MENIGQQVGREDDRHLFKLPINGKPSSREYFLSLLPSFSSDFTDKIEHHSFKELSPNIHFPFHVTLYYLGKLSADELTLARDWLNEKKAIQSPIRVKVNSVSSFKKDGEDFVYFLDLSSEEIDELNNELFERFSHLRRDGFDFRAHMTLFFPTKKITETQRKRLSSLFSDISEITFNQLILGSVLNEEIEINHLANLGQ